MTLYDQECIAHIVSDDALWPGMRSTHCCPWCFRTKDAYIIANDVPGRVAIDLNPNSWGLSRRLFVEKIPHDAALINVCAVDASCLCIDVVVDDIQLQAALCDGDAVVDRHKVTLCDLQTCTHTQTDTTATAVLLATVLPLLMAAKSHCVTFRPAHTLRMAPGHCCSMPCLCCWRLSPWNVSQEVGKKAPSKVCVIICTVSWYTFTVHLLAVFQNEWIQCILWQCLQMQPMKNSKWEPLLTKNLLFCKWPSRLVLILRRCVWQCMWHAWSNHMAVHVTAAYIPSRPSFTRIAWSV